MASYSKFAIVFSLVFVMFGAMASFAAAADFTNVSLVSPFNNTNFSALNSSSLGLFTGFPSIKLANVTFNVTVVGDVNTSATTWTILSNFTGIWAVNASNNTFLRLANGSTAANLSFAFTSVNISEGRYYWTVNASNGTFGNNNSLIANNSNFTFTVDFTPPRDIIAVSPLVNNTNSSSSSFLLNFTVNDSLTQISSCVFSNSTGNNVSGSNTLQANNMLLGDFLGSRNSCNMTFTGLADGIYNTTLYANDSSNNFNDSTRSAFNGPVYFTIDTTKPTAIVPNASAPGSTAANNSNLTAVGANNFTYVNFTFTELNPQATGCILSYNNGSGVANFSMTASIGGTAPANRACSFNVTNIVSGTGYQTQNYTVTINDSAGNTNTSGVYTINFDAASATGLVPFTAAGQSLVNNSNTTGNYTFVNFTFTDANPANCILEYNNGAGKTNYTMSTGFGGTNNSARYCFYNVTANFTNVVLSQNYTVYTNDSAGVTTASGLFYLNFDNVYPTNLNATVPTPANNNTNQSANYLLANWTFTELNPSACTLNVNGTNYTMTMTAPPAANLSYCFYNATGLTDGYYSFRFFVNDTAGNSNNSNFRAMRVDTVKPAQVATNPGSGGGSLNNTNLSANLVPINVTFVELNPANCTVEWNNGTVTNYTVAATGNGTGGYCSGTINPAFVASGQKANYTVYVSDGAGNVGASPLYTVNFDNVSPTTPQVAAGALANFTNTTFNYVFVNFSFTEANPTNCTLTFNTTNYTMNLFGNGSSAYCSYNVTTLVDGLHNYTVTAIDLSGNSNTTSTFTQLVDSLRPAAVVFASPSMANATNTSANYVFFNATFTELNAKNCSLVVDGANSSPTAMTLVGANTSAPYCFVNVTGVADGLHNATVIVTDSAGNQNGTILGFVRVDTTYPKAFSFVSPSANNSNTSSNYVFVNVSLNMTNPANCTLQFNNGTGNANYTMALTGSGSATYCSFNVTSNFTASGNYDNFSVYASSGAGLTNATGLRYVLYDTGAPSVSLTSPATGVTLTSTPALAFTYSDALTQGTCWAYVDGSTTGSQSGLTGAGSITPVGVGNAPHTWFINCIDNAGNSANSSSREFSLAPGSSTATTPAATVAPAPVPASSSSSSSGGSSGGLIPSSGGSPEVPAAVEKTETLGTSSSVSGSFTDTSTTLTVAYTAPASGFSGEVSYHMPLDFADYQAGLVKISPEPKWVKPGSIIAAWDVALAPKETFKATVEVAKPLGQSILKSFKAPSLVSTPVASARPVATAAPTQASSPSVPTPARTDNTLWYVVGALVLLGVLYYVFVGSKPARKGL